MFEREDRFVAMEYDDCDVSVGETIDDHMRSIGFQVLSSILREFPGSSLYPPCIVSPQFNLRCLDGSPLDKSRCY